LENERPRRAESGEPLEIVDPAIIVVGGSGCIDALPLSIMPAAIVG
jgi:hypothetical protein